MFGPIISKMVGDRYLVTIDHIEEMAPGASNGHVTGDVTRPWNVKVVTQIYLDAYISKEQLKTETRFQWDTNRSSTVFGCRYVENGWRFRLGFSETPVVNSIDSVFFELIYLVIHSVKCLTCESVDISKFCVGSCGQQLSTRFTASWQPITDIQHSLLPVALP